MDRRVFALMLGLCAMTAGVQAAPVDVIGQSDRCALFGDAGDGKWGCTLEAQVDVVTEREFEYSSEMEMVVPGIEWGVVYDKKFKGYVTLGQAMENKWSEPGAEFEFDDAFIWGLGFAANWWEQDGLKVFSDLSYRTFDDAELETLKIGGISYPFSGLGFEGEMEEWSMAVGVSKNLDMYTPYAGLRYSDAELTLKATAYSTAVSKDVDNNVGIFIGTLIEPMDNLSFDVQARFIDETAVTVSGTWQF